MLVFFWHFAQVPRSWYTQRESKIRKSLYTPRPSDDNDVSVAIQSCVHFTCLHQQREYHQKRPDTVTRDGHFKRSQLPADRPASRSPDYDASSHLPSTCSRRSRHSGQLDVTRDVDARPFWCVRKSCPRDRAAFIGQSE